MIISRPEAEDASSDLQVPRSRQLGAAHVAWNEDGWSVHIGSLTSGAVFVYREDTDRIGVCTSLQEVPRRAIDDVALGLLPSWKFMPPPLTPLADTYRVPNGFRLSGRWSSPWEDASLELALPPIDPGCASVDLTELLHREVEAVASERTVLFLSGGLDSTVLGVELARCVPGASALTLGYDTLDGRLAEREARASAATIGLEHSMCGFSEEQCLVELDQVDWRALTPHADVALLAESHLGRRALEMGFDTILEGEGADSAFCGSYKFLVARYHRLLRGLTPVLGAVASILPRHRRGPLGQLGRRAALLSELGLREGFEFGISTIGTDSFEALSRHALRDSVLSVYRQLWDWGGSAHNALAAITLYGVIPYLEAEKLAAVARRFRGRVATPFLSGSVVQVAFAIPEADKVRAGFGKVPLRKAYRTRMPRHLRSRRKGSFVPPVSDWILRHWRDAVADSPAWSELDPTRILEGHEKGLIDATAAIWAALVASRWAAARGES